MEISYEHSLQSGNGSKIDTTKCQSFTHCHVFIEFRGIDIQ